MIAYKSKMAKKETQERVWYVIDATDKVLGRLRPAWPGSSWGKTSRSGLPMSIVAITLS